MSAGGSGKGGDQRQAIYDPTTTNVLEQGLTGMAMGTAMRNNPGMGAIMGGSGMAQEPGYSGNTSGKGARRDMGRPAIGSGKGDRKKSSQVASQQFNVPMSGSDFLSS